MATEAVVIEGSPKRSFMDKMLDGIERVGNKVPHPVLMFFYLIVLVIVLSHVFYLMGVSVTEEIIVPVPVELTPDYYEDTTGESYDANPEAYDLEFETQETTIAIQSLLTVEGIRFIFTSFVPNFQNFGVVAVTLIAMMGAGVAEAAGLMNALIRKLVKVAPRRLITFLIVFVGALSSVASDAGYLILIPLGAAAFLAIKRHPIAGLAAAFGGVAATFAVNIIFTPIDAMLTEVTNEAIELAGGTPISITANYFFMVVSTLVLSIAITVVTERMVEPRLGAYLGDTSEAGEASEGQEEVDPAVEARGLRGALWGFLAVLVLVILATAFPGSPLRHPETGAIIGQTPFMDSLLFIIMLFFLVAGIGYGMGAGTFKHANDVIAGVTKTFASLAGLIFMLLMIAQFIAYFNFSNMPRIIAVNLADFLERAGISAFPLLVGMILIIILLDFIMPGALPKWAIFAPIFIPLFIRLGVAPQTVFAAYRIGDSPANTLTPLMVYLPFIVTVAQRYQKESGIGTIVALMLPYAAVVAVVWIILFALWFWLGIPLGPGYPVSV